MPKYQLPPEVKAYLEERRAAERERRAAERSARFWSAARFLPEMIRRLAGRD